MVGCENLCFSKYYYNFITCYSKLPFTLYMHNIITPSTYHFISFSRLMFYAIATLHFLLVRFMFGS